MRVGLNALFLIPGKVGGTEMYARRLVHALAEAAPAGEFLVYVAREATGSFRAIAPNVREVPCAFAAEQRVARIAYEQVQLPWLARRDRLDLLHSLGYTAPLVVGCPSVVTIHDLNYHFHPEDWTPASLWANRVLIPLVARRATRVLAISQSSRAAIRDVLRVPDDRIDVVYHGVDGNLGAADEVTLQRMRERLDLRGDYLLTVTASHPHKNLDGLLAAYRLLESPPPLVIVGIRGRDHARIEAAATASRGRILLTGWIDAAELAALYHGARAFVFASKYEGFGFPVLEAMSAGVPVASSTATSLAELVDGAAETFDPERPDAIAGAIDRVWRDDARRSELSSRGRRRASEFRWDRCARETLAVYRRALGS